MQRGRFIEDRIIGLLRRNEAGVKTVELSQKHGIRDATFYTWKAKYVGLTMSEATVTDAGDDNRRLKKLTAEPILVVSALKDLLEKN